MFAGLFLLENGDLGGRDFGERAAGPFRRPGTFGDFGESVPELSQEPGTLLDNNAGSEKTALKERQLWESALASRKSPELSEGAKRTRDEHWTGRRRQRTDRLTKNRSGKFDRTSHLLEIAPSEKACKKLA